MAVYTSPLPFYENSFTSHLRHNDEVVFSISNLSYESAFFFPNIRTSVNLIKRLAVYRTTHSSRQRQQTGNYEGEKNDSVRFSIICAHSVYTYLGVCFSTRFPFTIEECTRSRAHYRITRLRDHTPSVSA